MRHDVMKGLGTLVVALAGLVGANSLSHASPAIVWNQTPAATGGTATLGLVQNRAAEQNFGDPVTFSTNVLLTGIDVITADVTTSNPTEHVGYGFVGTPVVIRLHIGANNGPVQDFPSVINIRDLDGAPTTPGPNPAGSFWVRAHAELSSPVMLLAGVTYWIGMSDNTPGIDSLGQAFMTIGPNAPTFAQTTQYYGPSTITSVGLTGPPQISMIRLWGEASPDAATLLQQLAADVSGVGPGKSLADKVALAQTYYAVPDVQATCAILTDFVNEVRAQRGKKIAPNLADKLITDAQAIMAVIGCN